MSLHKFAEQVAAHGRGDDSLLVHMTPDEVQRLQAFAEANGRTMTINPDTGLPEAGFLSDLFKAVAPIALGAFLGPAGMGLTLGGLSSAATAGLVTGGITTLATGSLSRGLMAGLGAYGGAGLAEGISNVGATALSSEALAAANASADPIASLAAAKDAATAAGTMAPTGMQAFTEGAKRIATEPGGFNQFSNAMGGTGKLLSAGLMAASPIMADMMVPTTTKMPEVRQNNDTVSKYIRNEDGTLRYLYNAPAANYGTPAWKPFNEGGIVALSHGGMARYDAGGGVKDLTNLYAAFGGKEGYEKVQADYLKINNNPADFATAMAQFDKPSKFTPAPAAVVTPAAAAVTSPAVVTPAVGAGATKDYTNLYAAFGGKAGYDKLRDDYLKINNDTAAFDAAVAQFDKPSKFTPAPGAITTGGNTTATTGGNTTATTGGNTTATTGATPAYDPTDPVNKAAMDRYIGGYVTDLTTKFKTPVEQALEMMYRASTGSADRPAAAFDALGGYDAVRKLAQGAGYDARPEWFAAYEKKMGYKPSEYTLINSRITPAEIAAADKAAQDRINADAAAAANKVTSTGIVNLLTDTGVKTDKADTTTTGKNTLATTTASGVTSPKTTTDGTYTGTTGTAPTLNTLFGQGKFVGTGSEVSTGTTGPIMDFGGTSPFGLTSPMSLAQKQIAEESAAKTTADKNKLDLYSQWGAANPKATNLEHANFVDKIGLDPAVAARLIGISPEQAQNAYNDAKYNKQTGDSMAAYNYLMGKGAYPTKSNVGEIARPYAEATLGYPASTNKQYIYDKETGRYNRNPDYVAEYRDPTGAVNYALSPKEIFDYFKKNGSQDDAITYAWALANNLTPKDISEATGVPISQIAPKWRAAAAGEAAKIVRKEDGTIDKEATDKLAADKAAADKAAADKVAADKVIAENNAIKTNWDEAAYLAANPDVAAELASGKSASGQPVKFKSGYEHFTMFGQTEGRKPTAKAGSTTTTGTTTTTGGGNTVATTGGNTVATTGGGNTAVTTSSSELTNPAKIPTSDPGPRNEWVWDYASKKWYASQVEQAAGGGIMKLAMGGMPMDGYAVGGGLGALGSYSDGGRLLRGPGDGVSDSIPATIGNKQQPARLADGEFVVPARIVSELGNGSTEAGAKKLYAMMDRVQRARGKTTGKNKVAANSRADKYLPA